jgi:type II secretory pathway component PulK
LPHEDSASDAWFGKITLPKNFSDRMEIRIVDEESKFNLNAIPEGLLSAFFKVLEEEVSPLRGSYKDYVKEISKRQTGKRMESLEELLLMEGFYPPDLELLRPFLTVYSDSSLVNLNTAGPVILKALLNYLSGDYSAKQILLERLKQGALSSDDLLQETIAEKLKLPRTPGMMALVQTFLGMITIDSETFQMEIRLLNGRCATTVFRYRPGQVRPEILRWYEE